MHVLLLPAPWVSNRNDSESHRLSNLPNQPADVRHDAKPLPADLATGQSAELQKLGVRGLLSAGVELQRSAASTFQSEGAGSFP